MNKKTFFIILALITLLGFGLRTIDYDRLPPFGETMDELFYPWAGMTWITKGSPVGWSWFNAYSESKLVNKWGNSFRLVSPWLEKPPLYSLLSGSLMLMTGITEIFDVKLSIIRLLPIFLSIFTVFLTGIVGKKIFNTTIGILGAILYAVIPTIVMVNRLSLTENLLTPLMLVIIYILIIEYNKQKYSLRNTLLLSLFSGLALLTKQIAVAFIPIIACIYFLKRQWKHLGLYILITGIIGSIYPLIGYFFDWNLFIKMLTDFQARHAFDAAPQLISTLFRFQIIGHTNQFFADEIILFGYVLLFSSPWWIFAHESENENRNNYISIFLAFPLVYFVLLMLLETGTQGVTYYLWHIAPIFPFMTILISVVFYRLWDDLKYLQLLALLIFLGSGILRLCFVFLPKLFEKNWQYITLFIFVFSTLVWLFNNKHIKRIFLLFLGIIYIYFYIYTTIHLSQIYPSMPQPLQ